MKKKMTIKEYREFINGGSKQGLHKSNKFSAQRCSYNGISFDSKAEMRFYIRALELGVKFIHQKEFEILPQIKYKDKLQRRRIFTVDYSLIDYNLLVDVKGGKATKTEAFSLRVAMLKFQLKDLENPPNIAVVNGSDIDTFLFTLISTKPDISKYIL